MEELELHNDFKDFLKLLNSAKVEYLLIGGYAVGYYGHVRMTGDIDFWIAVNPQNAARVSGVVREFGFSDKISADLFLQPHKVFRMGLQPVRIELLTSISGLDFAEAFPRRVHGIIDGIEVDLIGLGDLKRNKKASGRLKDQDDLRKLEEASPERRDIV
jgi:predicted nucleotidyltransferase